MKRCYLLFQQITIWKLYASLPPIFLAPPAILVTKVIRTPMTPANSNSKIYAAAPFPRFALWSATPPVTPAKILKVLLTVLKSPFPLSKMFQQFYRQQKMIRWKNSYRTYQKQSLNQQPLSITRPPCLHFQSSYEHNLFRHFLFLN